MSLKKRYLALFVLALLVPFTIFPLHAQETSGEFPQDVADELQVALDELTTEGDVAGVVLLVDTPDGRFSSASGWADVENEIALETSDSFRVGSITKIFTSVLILQLQEEGVLSIDDTLDMWLPDIAEDLPYGDEITLYHLLTHTAGVYNYTDDFGFVMQIVNNPSREWEPSEIVRWVIDNNEPSFAPATEGEWNYSNTGFVLLGMVIESATGRDIAELYRERIFEPLDMTSAYLASSEEPTSELIQGYSEFGDVSDLNATGAWSAGAIVSNADDLNTFIRALFAGELFQNDDTLDLMTTPVDSGEYALGIAPYGEGLWGHSGGIPGFVSNLIYSEVTDTVLVVLANDENFDSINFDFDSLLISEE